MSDSDDSVIIVTTNDIPGYEVVQVLGELFGLIVRARNVFSRTLARVCAHSSAARSVDIPRY
jgi:uncharacterized protein YbjQ (UPF0145 family)